MKAILTFTTIGILFGLSLGALIFTQKEGSTQQTSCQELVFEKSKLEDQIKDLEIERQRLSAIKNPTKEEIEQLQKLTDKMMGLFFMYVGVRSKGKTISESLTHEEKQKPQKNCPEINQGLCPECPEKELLARVRDEFNQYRSKMEEKLEDERGKKAKKEDLKTAESVIKNPLNYYKGSTLIERERNQTFDRIQGNYEGFLEHVDKEKFRWKVEVGLDYNLGEEGYAGTSYVTMTNKDGQPFSRSRGDGNNNSFHTNKTDPNALVIQAAPDTFFRMIPSFGSKGVLTLKGTAYEISPKTKDYEYIGTVTITKLSN